MIITLPTVKKTYDEQTETTTVTREDLRVEIDTSFKAHLKWEEQFQSQKGIDLTEMTAKVSGWVKDAKKAALHMSDMLRVLYCYINTDKLPTFSDFVGILEPENALEVIEKIGKVLAETGKTIAKK